MYVVLPEFSTIYSLFSQNEMRGGLFWGGGLVPRGGWWVGWWGGTWRGVVQFAYPAGVPRTRRWGLFETTLIKSFVKKCPAGVAGRALGAKEAALPEMVDAKASTAVDKKAGASGSGVRFVLELHRLKG